jgi:hypothetical protein
VGATASCTPYLEKFVFLLGINLHPFSECRLSDKCNVYWKHHQLALTVRKEGDRRNEGLMRLDLKACENQ